ncbi:uncharacterized protein CC84DRAFT_1256381 [Paraphaeosphaeria sporulosa]|uniref:Uncharacterized protein n=1 Tax=Paraphaeosphaeria sporulosa TaxID=1460663 RepID=A0A177CSP8_9PLEO|nr:uncharacterized protein CC84DRAFT_1256381 [Paraphaeosphaeria sporulosa]OAG10564.1 hypothetical protein CC84DRAFT_1256381 [Paraphaeosphaeria sporulosa]
MAGPSAPVDQAPAAADTLTCKACRRTLATITADGELRPHGALDEGCALCKDMVKHCNEYEEVKGYFKELEHRRDDYRPRQLALEVVHEAQMNLGNFIQAVAAWGDSGDGHDDEDEACGGSAGEQHNRVQEQEQTATPPADAQPHRKRILSPASSPPRKHAKRPRLSERQRRVSFDPSVVFRDAEAASKRVDAEFSRNSEGYSRGRYTAPEGTEWLDTSGNSLRETQFFGVQKRGRKWVPTKEGMEMDEEWEMGSGEGHAEEEGSGGIAATGDVDEKQEHPQDVQMKCVGKETETTPSRNIPLPYRTSVGLSDPSSDPPGPDTKPSSEGAADIQIVERPSIFGDGKPSAPLDED